MSSSPLPSSPSHSPQPTSLPLSLSHTHTQQWTQHSRVSSHKGTSVCVLPGTHTLCAACIVFVETCFCAFIPPVTPSFGNSGSTWCKSVRERSSTETLKVRTGSGSSCSNNHRPGTVKVRVNNSDRLWPGECLHPLVRRCTSREFLFSQYMKVQQLTKVQLEVSPGVNIRGDILRAGRFGTLPYKIMGDLPASESNSHTASSVPQPSGQHNS